MQTEEGLRPGNDVKQTEEGRNSSHDGRHGPRVHKIVGFILACMRVRSCVSTKKDHSLHSVDVDLCSPISASNVSIAPGDAVDRIAACLQQDIGLVCLPKCVGVSFALCSRRERRQSTPAS